MRILFLLLCTNWMCGQQLHHHMMSAQGKTISTSNGIKVTQTISQQSSIGTTTTGKLIVSRGFQQSKISTVKPLPNLAITTLVYPNPVVDFVKFAFSAPISGKIAFSIFDIHGRLLLSRQQEAEGNILTITNLQLAAGEYFVKLDGNQYSFSTSILKSN